MEYENLVEGNLYYHPSIGEIYLSDKPNLCFTAVETNESFLLPNSHLESLTN